MTAGAAGDIVEVAIVGAGPAGAATARRLALQGRRVVLIEQSDFSAARVGESLAPDTQPLLRALGLWREFMALGPLASYGTRSHWGTATPEMHSHMISPWGSGWHVDRPAFDRMLAEGARSAGSILMTKTTVTGCTRVPDGWALTLCSQDGGDDRTDTLRTRFVVDASGRAARLARWVGARRFLLDYLVALAVACAGVDTADEGYVMVETTPDGWWYSAPIPDGSIMVMLMTDSDLCARDGLALQTEWRQRLRVATATSTRIANALPAVPPQIFSAVSQRLRRRDFHMPFLAVGDSALAVDPISGSGVVRALRGAEAAASAISEALAGRANAIAAYEAAGDRDCSAYLEERALYYALEQRWRQSPFWQRRAGVAAAAMHA
jgi:flavin-dependent dehydrogenase